MIKFTLLKKKYSGCTENGSGGAKWFRETYHDTMLVVGRK